MAHRQAYSNSDILENTFASLERRLNLSITYYDVAGLCSDEHGAPLLSPLRQSHRKASVCGIGYDRPRCLAHCRGEVLRRASLSELPFTHICWKGIEEVAVPLWWHGTFMGLLLAGSWQGQAPPESQLNRKEFERVYSELDVLREAVSDDIHAILSAAGKGMLARLDELAQGLPDERPTSRTEIVRRFLRYQLAQDCSLEALARVLHLSPSRTSHVVRDLFGKPFRDLVRAERMQRAKTLLLSSDLTVREIASRVGVESEYHFSRLFKADCGQPPGSYRRMNQNV